MLINLSLICRNEEITSLNRSLIGHLSELSQWQRHACALEYLPHLRTIAREDEVGRALVKHKIIRRYLAQFSIMGMFIPDDQLILAANCFSVQDRF